MAFLNIQRDMTLLHFMQEYLRVELKNKQILSMLAFCKCLTDFLTAQNFWYSNGL